MSTDHESHLPVPQGVEILLDDAELADRIAFLRNSYPETGEMARLIKEQSDRHCKAIFGEYQRRQKPGPEHLVVVPYIDRSSLHRSTCRHVQRLSPHLFMRIDREKAQDEVERCLLSDDGLKPCKTCNPLEER